ncbi:hypothetical protein LTR36_009970 [Oleoguttula mirabilis]|uniref:DNA2/NAM7 helicase-like C-terminal domain-containing protein n=1 Tax=Oleoguttula mirabilis TaxID=1507867 RepID=A0AAV9J4R6_9PEZI|nr:hypothetical protein LTR36_009970 [Oleoguttula mirabilis]
MADACASSIAKSPASGNAKTSTIAEGNERLHFESIIDKWITHTSTDISDSFIAMMKAATGKTGELTEAQKRMHWFEIRGDNIMTSSETGSKANWAHYLYAMNLIKGHLHKHYGATMSEQVMLITPYARHKQLYQAAFQALRDQQGWTEAELPILADVASSIGHHRNILLIDLVVSKSGSDLDGMKDDRRLPVVFTCAKMSCWVIAGDLQHA